VTPAFATVPPRFVMSSPLRASAWRFASERHDGQSRWDGAPFILHPLEVASLLANTGHGDEVVAAGLLHDVLEKSDATRDELDGEFGARIAAVVAAVSEDTSIAEYAERKRRLREQSAAGGDDALAVMAADKVAKVRELRAQVTRRGTPPDAVDRERLAHYELTLDVLRAHLPDLPLGRQLEFELWALAALPPIMDA
jgi:(p)ppGpp synthase/HD superfamily hydrolase